MAYNEFVFEDYRYDWERSTLSLCYSYNGGPRFEEQLIFDFAPQQLSPAVGEVLDRIFRLILLLSGVSYYKAFIPRVLTCRAFELDEMTAEFLQKFYQKGLAEFAFRNGVSLHGHFRFQSSSTPAATPITVDLPRRTCVPVGGGKDLIVTIECLRQGGEPLVLFSLGDAEPIAACIAAAKLPFIRVHRRLDAGLLKLNETGALNGHVPITGILSAIALASAVMSGCNAVAMSNEHSASAPNLSINGVEVNHQYSKSLEFELDLARYIERFHFTEHQLFLAVAAIVGNRDCPKILEIPGIFWRLPKLQYGIPASARGARAPLVLQLSEMPVRVSGAFAVCRKAGSDRNFRLQPAGR